MPLAVFDPDNAEHHGCTLYGETAKEILEQKMFGRLSRMLLNPNLDRCDITDAILADRELIQFLRGYRAIVVDQVIPPGSSWKAIEESLSDFGLLAVELGEPRDTFVMPVLMGRLLDENDRLWFQSSPFEFVPAAEGIQTTNLGTKPTFDARTANDPRPARTDGLPILSDLVFP